ncbi:MAG: hypothetical protein R3C16_00655 [Hyphomonadaceae bacterium]
MAAAKVAGDQLAVIGQNRKLLIFPLSELPEMTRGKGVKLQAYHDKGLLDMKVFAKAEGSPGRTAPGASGKCRNGPTIAASAVRPAGEPRGFSRSGRFSDVIG